jgi:hypothetical protein
MLEVITSVLIGAIVAFFCMQFYRQGIKDGRRDKENKSPEPIFQKPAKDLSKNTEIGQLAKVLGWDGTPVKDDK